MDKLMDNRWFIKVVALLLAILLYSSVPNGTNKLTDVNVPGDQTTDTITDVPVKAYFDTENLVVSGIPNTVKVRVQGPKIHVQSAKAQRNFEVYVDLTKAKIGKQTVKLKIRNLSDKLKATVSPAYLKVSVQEKVSEKFNVGAEYNPRLVADGYTAGKPIVEPNIVTVTGAKDVVDRITYVKAALNLRGTIFETLTQNAAIQVLDRDLNKLDVTVEPETVKVTIPIKHTSKTVPIDVVKKGTAPTGVKIGSIDLDKKEATITGDEAVLDKTDHVRVEVDLSKIYDDTTLTLPVIIPNGVTKVSPELVKAKVTIGKSSEKTGAGVHPETGIRKTVSDIPIKAKGLTKQYSAIFKNPPDQNIDVSVYGPTERVGQITARDFTAYVDLAGLGEGSHNVKIQVDGPSDLKLSPNPDTADIKILKMNAKIQRYNG